MPSDRLPLKIIGEMTSSKVTIKWVIPNFLNQCSATPLQTRWVSPPYDLGGTRRCCLLLIPDEEHFALYLFSFGGDFKISAKLFILNSSQEEVKAFHVANCTMKKGLIYGINKYLKPSDLSVGSPLLQSGQLVVGCEISFDLETKESEKNPEPPGDLFRLRKLDEYEELFESKKFSDIVFIVEGREILAHKNIIANKTPVFTAMFDHDMKESDQNIVKITDISYNAMYELLRFVYAGKIKDMASNAEDLLIASEKYLIKELKMLCEDFLSKNLTSGNVVHHLNLANMYNAAHLRAEGIKFITHHAEEIADAPDFDTRELDPEVMREVFHSMAKSKKRKLE
ncbi:hypothetical protein QAD02_004639 [Eretmocerus hayati]|uniref:Uncharacterized protein n=1 Tax=Eretmocerus hayati TaxID=131215 RepID=A0ACC2NT25_9HYME|nr:hypothetical protein QAD02_004639 [Eretmocerus hayati]